MCGHIQINRATWVRAVLSDLNTLYLGWFTFFFFDHGDNLQKERFVLVHDFRGLSSQSLVPHHGDSTVWWANSNL